MPKNKPSRGVLLFGIGLLLSTLYKIYLLMFHYEHFVYLFGHMPKEQFQIRFFLSWADKIVELVAAIGILCLNDFCRKMAIIIWFLIICTVPIKHPFDGFQKHIRFLDQVGIISIHKIEKLGMSEERLVWWSVWAARLQDSLFGLCLIYFFTRKQVKEQFKS